MKVFVCMKVIDVDGEEIEIIFQRDDIKFIARYKDEAWITIQASPDKQVRYKIVDEWDDLIDTLKRIKRS